MIVPDSIEPLEMFRGWNVVKGRLCSLNSGQVWQPGEPFHASCDQGENLRWSFVKRGWTLERAESEAKLHNNQAHSTWQLAMMARTRVPVRAQPYLRPPTVEPPAGYGYALETETHDAPDARCTCGVYAVSEQSGVPGATAIGKVKLWGKIVPGEAGARAEFAYPSEVTVPRSAYQSGLEDYGVPVTVLEEADPASAAFADFTRPSFYRRHGLTLVLCGLNGGAAGANVALLLHRVL